MTQLYPKLRFSTHNSFSQSLYCSSFIVHESDWQVLNIYKRHHWKDQNNLTPCRIWYWNLGTDSVLCIALTYTDCPCIDEEIDIQCHVKILNITFDLFLLFSSRFTFNIIVFTIFFCLKFHFLSPYALCFMCKYFYLFWERCFCFANLLLNVVEFHNCPQRNAFSFICTRCQIRNFSFGLWRNSYSLFDETSQSVKQFDLISHCGYLFWHLCEKKNIHETTRTTQQWTKAVRRIKLK